MGCIDRNAVILTPHKEPFSLETNGLKIKRWSF
jgi:hypothetical protein